MSFVPKLRPVLTLAALLCGTGAFAQSSNPGYFIPPSAQQSGPAPAAAAAPQAAPAPQPQAQSQPPIPQLPALPPEAPPPAAIIGVLSVPQVMRNSTAAQGVQAIIQQREAALSQDEQDAAQEIQAEAAKAQGGMANPQLRNKIAALQTKFAERNQAIRNSGQAALGQVEAELIGIIKQEAQAHGMNLVLQRDQVALNMNGFDITDAVTAQLNTLLPSVTVPPSVVTPGMAIDPPDQGGDGQGDGQ